MVLAWSKSLWMPKLNSAVYKTVLEDFASYFSAPRSNYNSLHAIETDLDNIITVRNFEFIPRNKQFKKTSHGQFVNDVYRVEFRTDVTWESYYYLCDIYVEFESI